MIKKHLFKMIEQYYEVFNLYVDVQNYYGKLFQKNEYFGNDLYKKYEINFIELVNDIFDLYTESFLMCIMGSCKKHKKTEYIKKLKEKKSTESAKKLLSQRNEARKEAEELKARLEKLE